MTPRERPILFNAPLVRAILAGTKHVTRRPVKLRDDECYRYDPFGRVLGHMAVRDGDESDWRNIRELGAPYGAPGDRLWLRETWAAYTKPSESDECDEIECAPAEMPERYGTTARDVVYRADGKNFPKRWRPSLHMPRWASRILLEVTDVRVERLQDITEEDACAEGIHASEVGVRLTGGCREQFRRTWDAIYGEGAWDANPWVWRIAFKRIGGAL